MHGRGIGAEVSGATHASDTIALVCGQARPEFDRALRRKLRERFPESITRAFSELDEDHDARLSKVHAVWPTCPPALPAPLPGPAPLACSPPLRERFPESITRAFSELDEDHAARLSKVHARAPARLPPAPCPSPTALRPLPQPDCPSPLAPARLPFAPCPSATTRAFGELDGDHDARLFKVDAFWRGAHRLATDGATMF